MGGHINTGQIHITVKVSQHRTFYKGVNSTEAIKGINM